MTRYLIKALKAAPGNLFKDHTVQWEAGEIHWVEESEIHHYEDRPDCFYIMGSGTGSETHDAGSMAAAFIDFTGTAEAAMTITIGGIVYTEADTAVPASGIFTNGASAADSATSLIAAINGDTRTTVPFTAVADTSGDGLWVVYDAVGRVSADGITLHNLAISTTSAANCTVPSAFTGAAEPSLMEQFHTTRTVTTHELNSGAIVIPLPWAPAVYHVTVYSATGLMKAITDLITAETIPNRLEIDTDGATNLANTDVVHVSAYYRSTATALSSPSSSPSASPSSSPSEATPSSSPSASPSEATPSVSPSASPSSSPSASPSSSPSSSPSVSPSASPTEGSASSSPSASPSASPTEGSVSASPSASPSATPSGSVSGSPSSYDPA